MPLEESLAIKSLASTSPSVILKSYFNISFCLVWEVLMKVPQQWQPQIFDLLESSVQNNMKMYEVLIAS